MQDGVKWGMVSVADPAFPGRSDTKKCAILSSSNPSNKHKQILSLSLPLMCEIRQLILAIHTNPMRVEHNRKPQRI